MKNNIKISSLNFKFDKQTNYFFKNLNYEFEAQKMHFICGANGIGKSTFFKVLQGKIGNTNSINGAISLGTKTYDLPNEKTSLTNFISELPQNCELTLANEFTVKQNCALAQMAKYPSLKTLSETQKIEDIANKFNINQKSVVKNLSGGQKQILSIIMSLQKNESVLLLDEPTAALDSRNSVIVMDFLQELLEKTCLTILIICHDHSLVKKYSPKGFHEFIIFDDGSRNLLPWAF